MRVGGGEGGGQEGGLKCGSEVLHQFGELSLPSSCWQCACSSVQLSHGVTSGKCKKMPHMAFYSTFPSCFA
jgi:hypothetical protein